VHVCPVLHGGCSPTAMFGGTGAVTALANAGAEPWGALLCVGIRDRAGRGGLLRICAQSKALWGVHGVGWLSYVLRREPFGLD
jgi:hypothetical protein